MDILTEFKNWQTDYSTLENFFNWVRFNSNIKTLKLDIDDNLEELREEILPKISVSVTHREEEGNGWRSATLHGYNSVMTDSDGFYLDQGFNLPTEKYWTSISSIFPKTKEWIIKNIPFAKYGRIRLMIVEPGGSVLPHKDYPHGQCLAGINIAINHPDSVRYIINNESIHWSNGDSRLIDIGSLHEIYNESDDYRVHIIVHSEPIDIWSKEMMSIVCRSYLKSLEN
jgi:hypothetical protein